MKIALVYPDAFDASKRYHLNTLGKYPTRPPLGILYLAAVLEQKGHQVKIFDNALLEQSNNASADSILEYKPAVVGFSTTFKNLCNGRETAKLIKKSNHNIKVIFGGPEVIHYSADLVAHPFIDMVVLGEADHAFPDLVDGKFKNLDSVPGLVYKGPNGKVRTNPVGPPILDLDALPYPALHLVDVNAYIRKWPQFTPFTILTSRGCPYRCSFCSRPPQNRKYRARDPIKVVGEIEHMVKAYGATKIDFIEENFAVVRDNVIKMCEEIIRRGIKISWNCNTRVNNVDRELLLKMKMAGLYTIFFGVESGSQRVLDLMKKDTDLEQIRKTFKTCREVGVHRYASMMLGVPGETKSEVFDSLDFAVSLKPDQFSFQTYLGIPGSELYEKVKKEKLYSEEWETSLIVSTKELPRKEVVKLEKEMEWRMVLFKILARFGVKMPVKNHNYHYDKPVFKDLFAKLRDKVHLIKEKPGELMIYLEKLSQRLEKVKRKDGFEQSILAYLYLLLGVLHYKKGSNKKAQELAQMVHDLDKEVPIPYEAF